MWLKGKGRGEHEEGSVKKGIRMGRNAVGLQWLGVGITQPTRTRGCNEAISARLDTHILVERDRKTFMGSLQRRREREKGHQNGWG